MINWETYGKVMSLISTARIQWGPKFVAGWYATDNNENKTTTSDDNMPKIQLQGGE